jgi:hypothetical protein
MNNTFIDFASGKNCYAVLWSYGEICVGCNCCGQFGKGIPMFEARIKYHRELLNENIRFNNWCKGWEKIQKHNKRENVTYHKFQIKKLSIKLNELRK